MRRRVLILSSVVFLVCVAVGSALILRSEYASFRYAKTNGQDAFLALFQDGGHAPVPVSKRARVERLEMCNEALAAPIATLVEDALAHKVAQRCLNVAQELIDAVPTWGLAHFTHARALHRLGAHQEAVDALAASQTYAPLEGWIAKKRLLLTLDILNTQDLSTQDGADVPVVEIEAVLRQDIDTLSSHDALVHWLADFYNASPENRSEIIAQMERQSERVQARFLARVKTPTTRWAND